MSRPTALEGFGAKLKLVLDRLNLSRGGLAQRVGVDKSVVHRWASGAVQPGETSIVAITAVVQKEVTGFSKGDWALTEAAFATKLGFDPSRPSGDGRALARELSLTDRTRAEGARYAGLWAVLYGSMLSEGGRTRLYGGAIEIVEGTDGWRCLASDGIRGVWTGEGVVWALGGKLYLLADRQPEYDALVFFQYWGVPSGVPAVLDGLCVARSASLMGPPTATYSVAFRLTGAAPSEAVARARWARAANHMGALCEADLAARLPPPLVALFRQDASEQSGPRRLVVSLTGSIASEARHSSINAEPDSPGGAGLQAIRALFASIALD